MTAPYELCPMQHVAIGDVIECRIDFRVPVRCSFAACPIFRRLMWLDGQAQAPRTPTTAPQEPQA